MTNKEILEKAIQKAIDGGYPGDVSDYKTDGLVIYRWLGHGFMEFDILTLIFSHPFAKALWGESYIERYVIVAGSNELVESVAFEYHLQQMVVADDPIEYLGESI